MTFAWNKKSTIFASALLFFFLLSLALFLFLADTKQQIVLFFPNDTNHQLTGEMRVVPKKSTVEGNMAELVNGLILGPEALRHDRALAKSTQIRSLMVRGSEVYLDFSPGILFPEGNTSTGFSESLDAVRKSIRFNFPEIKKIVITVNGELPKSEIIANT